jgi:hypothetical protein
MHEFGENIPPPSPSFMAFGQCGTPQARRRWTGGERKYADKPRRQQQKRSMKNGGKYGKIYYIVLGHSRGHI